MTHLRPHANFADYFVLHTQALSKLITLAFLDSKGNVPRQFFPSQCSCYMSLMQIALDFRH